MGKQIEIIESSDFFNDDGSLAQRNNSFFTIQLPPNVITLFSFKELTKESLLFPSVSINSFRAVIFVIHIFSWKYN